MRKKFDKNEQKKFDKLARKKFDKRDSEKFWSNGGLFGRKKELEKKSKMKSGSYTNY